MQVNEVGNKTPQNIMNEYISKRVNGYDYIFDDVECVVVSTQYGSGRSNIISKLLRKRDLDNENIRQ